MSNSIESAVSTRRLSLIRAEVDRVLGCIAAGGDHYVAMGIDESASIDDIRQAYRRAVERLHPLKCQDIVETDGVMRWKLSQAFLRIVEAFSTLSRAARRIEYNARLAEKPTTVAPPIPPIRNTPLPRDSRASHKGTHPEKHLVGDASSRTELRRVTNRRRAARLALRVPVYVQFSGGDTEQTESCDVSRSGIRMRLTRRPELGTKLTLILPMPAFLRTHSRNEKYYSIVAIVRHIRQSDAAYLVGAEFVTASGSPDPT